MAKLSFCTECRRQGKCTCRPSSLGRSKAGVPFLAQETGAPHGQKGNLLFFGADEGEKRAFPVSLYPQLPLAQNNLHAKVVYLNMAHLTAFIINIIELYI